MKFKYTLIAAIASILSFTANAAPVNINTATANEIADSLSGVGVSKAQAIVQYRSQNGHFKSAKDIIMVKGIGQSTFSKNKQDILIK